MATKQKFVIGVTGIDSCPHPDIVFNTLNNAILDNTTFEDVEIQFVDKTGVCKEVRKYCEARNISFFMKILNRHKHGTQAEKIALDSVLMSSDVVVAFTGIIPDGLSEYALSTANAMPNIQRRYHAVVTLPVGAKRLS